MPWLPSLPRGETLNSDRAATTNDNKTKITGPMMLDPHEKYEKLERIKITYEVKGRKLQRHVRELNNFDPYCIAYTVEEFEDVAKTFGFHQNVAEGRMKFREFLVEPVRHIFDLAVAEVDEKDDGPYSRQAIMNWTERLIAKDTIYDQQVRYMKKVPKPYKMDNSAFRSALETIARAMRRLPRTGWNPDQVVYSQEDIHDFIHHI